MCVRVPVRVCTCGMCKCTSNNKNKLISASVRAALGVHRALYGSVLQVITLVICWYAVSM